MRQEERRPTIKFRYTKRQLRLIARWEKETGFEMLRKTGNLSFKIMWEFNAQWLRDWCEGANSFAKERDF